MSPRILSYWVTAAFLFMGLYLFKMQIIDHSIYREKSERNRVRPMILEAARGVIVDRNGKELVGNRLSFDCYILPQSEEVRAAVFVDVAKILELEAAGLEKKYQSSTSRRFAPILLARDITREQAIRIEEGAHAMPGVIIKTGPVRQYHLGESAAHVLGYVGAIGPNEFKRMREFGYRRTDRVGRDGVEMVYDSYLRGRHGATQFEVDNRGRLLRTLRIQDREEGRRLELTLDGDLQVFASGLMQEKSGAIAVMELETGGLLALVSAPTYDPNLFVSSSQSPEIIQNILQSPKLRMLNRVLAGEYPPGSTYKIVTALAALRSGRITTKSTHFCPGSYMIGKHRFRCWRKSGHGDLNLIHALEQSCNVFFYQLGLKTGASVIEKTSKLFGLGERTGVDLPQEKKGLSPGPQWKKKAMRERWYGGETANLSIGQGYLLTTPIQMLRVIGAIASGGKLFIPHVVEAIGEVKVSPGRIQELPIREDRMKAVQKGLSMVVQSKYGTGQKARTKIVRIAGKTGTAQAPHGADHAWFVGYAPIDDPKAAIVVMVEHGGMGGRIASPIAKQVFEWMHERGYFK